MPEFVRVRYGDAYVTMTATHAKRAGLTPLKSHEAVDRYGVPLAPETIEPLAENVAKAAPKKSPAPAGESTAPKGTTEKE